MITFSQLTGFDGFIDHMFFTSSAVLVVLALSVISSVALALKTFKRI